MIYKISCGALFLFLIIAIVLALNGITEVRLGADFTAFMRSVSITFDNWDYIKIPDIPSIPSPPNTEGWNAVVNVLTGIGNFFIGVLNFVIIILNGIKDILLFITAIFTELYRFLKQVIQNNSSDSALQLVALRY